MINTLQLKKPMNNIELQYDFKQGIEWISSVTNRSIAQTQFLLHLVDDDLDKLKLLEIQIKNCLCFYCPSTKEEIDEIMKLTPKTHWFYIDKFHLYLNRKSQYARLKRGIV